MNKNFLFFIFVFAVFSCANDIQPKDKDLLKIVDNPNPPQFKIIDSSSDKFKIIEISTSTSNAKIEYTINNATYYGDNKISLKIFENTIIKATAFIEDNTKRYTSDSKEFSVTIVGIINPPQFEIIDNSSDGEYQLIKISTSSPNAKIEYEKKVDNSTDKANGDNGLTLKIYGNTTLIATAFVEDSGKKYKSETRELVITMDSPSPIFYMDNEINNDYLDISTHKSLIIKSKFNGTIYYTTDDSTPDIKQKNNFGEGLVIVPIRKNIRIKAFVHIMNRKDSKIVTKNISIKVPSPDFSIDSDSNLDYATNIIRKLIISSKNGGTIYYTINNPITATNALKNGNMDKPVEIDINKRMTIRAYVKLGDITSDTITKEYIMKLSPPDFSIDSDSDLNSATNIIRKLIISSKNGGTIYYTINNPIAATNAFKNGNIDKPVEIDINKRMTIRAYVKLGDITSDTITKEYIMKLSPPDFSIDSDSDLNSATNTIRKLIISSKNGGIICYTINKNSVTESSNNTVTIDINKRMTIRAYVKLGDITSDTITKDYNMKLSPPLFSIDTDSYLETSNNVERTLIISNNSSGRVCYKIGSSNTLNGNIGEPVIININRNMFVTAYVSLLNSGVEITSDSVTKNYFMKLQEPIFSLDEGTYNESQNLTITSPIKDGKIYYNINNPRNPDVSFDNIVSDKAILYIEKDSIVKAIVKKDNCISSNIITKIYTINGALFNLRRLNTTSTENIYWGAFVLRGDSLEKLVIKNSLIGNIPINKKYRVFNIMCGQVDQNGTIVKPDTFNHTYSILFDSSDPLYPNIILESDIKHKISFEGFIKDFGSSYTDNKGKITHFITFVEETSSDYKLLEIGVDFVRYYQNGKTHKIFYDSLSYDFKYELVP